MDHKKSESNRWKGIIIPLTSLVRQIKDGTDPKSSLFKIRMGTRIHDIMILKRVAFNHYKEILDRHFVTTWICPSSQLQAD